jgi:hypothetical protein
MTTSRKGDDPGSAPEVAPQVWTAQGLAVVRSCDGTAAARRRVASGVFNSWIGEKSLTTFREESK